MAVSICSGLTGFMPASVTHPAGKRSRAVTWITLMRPSWRMSRQPDDRAHLGSAALHHAGRQSREQRTGQRGRQAEHTRHGRGRCGRVLGGNNREKERRRAAGRQHPGELLLVLSLVPWAALLVKSCGKFGSGG